MQTGPKAPVIPPALRGTWLAPVLVGQAFKQAALTLERTLKGDRLIDGLKLFARFEADGSSGRDGNFGTRSGVAADAGLSGAYVEHAESTQFNAIARRQGLLHALEHSFDGHLGLGLRDASLGNHFINDVEFDHKGLPDAGQNRASSY